MRLFKLACASLLFLAGAVRAQEVTGTIVGTITDQSGGHVVGARIIVTATEQNRVVRTLESGTGGEYVAALLPVGHYSIAVDAKGFKKLVRSGIELHLAEKLTVPLALEVGTLTEEVTVVGDVPQVELQTPAASGLITGNEVREIALNNRNYLELLILMPGVVSNSGSDELPIGAVTQAGAVNSLPFSFNGGRTSGNNFMVDGADNVDRGANQTLLATPSVDAIAEFKAVRGVYSAEFGRSASGQVNVITKSGTSKIHADAHEFFRNDKLAANDFFSNGHSIPRPPLRYNNFGYTVGGPVFIPGHYNQEKNKTFFFWSQEYRRVINYGSTQQSLMPTDDMKKGIFPSPVCILYNAAVTTCQQTANRIDNINPVAAAYIKDVWSKLPAGNTTDFTVFAVGRNLYNYREELIKIDQNVGPKLALAVRYLHDTVNTQEALGYQVNNPLPGIATSQTQTPGDGTSVRATSTLSPSLLNEAGFAYSYGGKFSQSIGLNNETNSPDIKVALPYASTLGRIPSLSISGLTSINGFGPYVNWSRNFNWFDNLTKLRGKQTLKFGGTFNYYQKSENAAANNAGSFTFNSTPRVTPTSQTVQNWANFLLGNVSSYTQTSLDLIPDMRQRQFEVYAQDDIRLRKNFTLNVGVRYSMFRLPYDDNHMLTNFDPTRWDPKKAPQVEAATGNVVAGTGDPMNGIVVNGKDSPYGGKTAADPAGKFAPRIGFAWDPFGTGKTAIRSGYGISFDSTLVGMFENNIFTNPPYLNNLTISNTRLENPAAGVTVISAAPKTLRGTPLPATLPYTQSYSFDIMRQVTNTFLLDVGYYGSKSTHLLGIVDINQVRPGAAVAAGITTADIPINSTLTPRLNMLRPFLGYGPVNVVENWFNSNYNALQASAQQRLSGNSTLRLAYSYSKVMTDATSDRANAPQNFYNRAADYARATFDRTHVITVSYVYELPFARSSRGVPHAALHGWQLSGVASFVTGLPYRVTSTMGSDWGGIGLLASGTTATPRPDMIGDPNTNAPHTVLKWFNTEAFAVVPKGQVRPGNAPASCVVGPGYQQWDLSLMRNVKIHEKFKLQIRAESFNFLNHTNPSALATALGSSNLGNITSAREPRRIQLALKLGF